MRVDLQLKINAEPRLISFIRERPMWYKILNRNPYEFDNFIKDMKKTYKLNTSDKINKTLDNISMIQTLLSVIK